MSQLTEGQCYCVGLYERSIVCVEYKRISIDGLFAISAQDVLGQERTNAEGPLCDRRPLHGFTAERRQAYS